MPIKVVDGSADPLLQYKNIVVQGEGAVTSVVALLNTSKDDKRSRRMLRVLLDSGADGDLLMVHEGAPSIVPYQEKLRPQKWKTSNGTFETSHVGRLEVIFPDYSRSKVAKFRPDIVKIPASHPKPIYDLIIGVKSLAHIGTVLNFAKQTVTIDQIELPMRPHDSFMSPKELRYQFRRDLEPKATADATARVERILDAKYEKADIRQTVLDNCKHLTLRQQQALIHLLESFEELFDGTLGDWDTEPVHFELKKDAKPYHGKAFPVPRIHLETLKKEIARLCKIGVLKRQPSSVWAAPTFIIPKKNKQVRFISDFREVNKRIVRNPYPLPKISSVLQEMEGFTYASQLDLNMGYYTIRLDGDSQKICTIILPWGKYSYMRLPMGVACSPDIFQEKMSGLMESLYWVKVYIDDLLSITKGTFEDHLERLREVLQRLQKAGLRVNIAKSTFAMDEVEYLGYILSRSGIKPMPEKVTAILAIMEPNNVKSLRRFLGMVQYYRDIWEKRSDLLAPLTDLVGECGQTKETRRKGTKKKPWYWDERHQKAFDAIKKVVAREVLLAYPDYTQPFEIYTDASSRQLGAVIVQKNRPLAFFSRKLSDAQQKYSITELELLSIVECLKEFRGMLWGQKIKIYTDHQNLTRDALGLTSNRVYRWRLILEEYGPEIVYIKGVDNTVADAISRLEYCPNKKLDGLSMQTCFSHMVTLFCHYMEKHDGREASDADMYLGCHTSVQSSIDDLVDDFANLSFATVFANTGDEEEDIYPITISEVSDAQRLEKSLKKYFKRDYKPEKRDRLSLKVLDDVEVVTYDDKSDRGPRMVVPRALQSKVVAWYHHYLQHPGHTRLEETIAATMYWRGMRTDIRRHVRSCEACQKGKRRKRAYGKLPPKIAEVTPWAAVCVDLVGPYTLKGKDGTILDFMCLTMIDPATGWFEVIELPLACVTVKRKEEEIVEVIIDKSSASISQLFNKQWLSRYPRPKYIIYDQGSEFKLHFEALCESYNVERKPTTVRNPQANAILERIHGVFSDMMRTSLMDMSDTVTPSMIDDFLVAAAWAIRSTYHTVLGSSPGAAVFGRDMLFDIPYLADWRAIGQRRQASVDHNNARENARRIDYDYVVGQQVLVRKDGTLRKAETRYLGPYAITQVHTNGTVRIQRGTMSERLNIRRITPYYPRT
jgi:hypothetical protein